ncbi:hypothetical protein CCMA1212_010126 [Trichoderma ghanense]|uniref:RNA polymerase II transcription factor SIII subunit A n=1 Tax=Trichoderma ghanense TaxID=65468 RepID=A0ABY2GQA0_9HYPO
MSPVKSLRELAMMAILKNIREVNNIGYLSYETVNFLLRRVDSAAQLRQIELNSPHIQGETAEEWVRLIERDFPLESRHRAYRPKDPKNWYRVWEKYKADQDKFLAQSEDKLKSSLQKFKEEEEKKTSKIIELGAIPSSKKGAIRRSRAKTSSNSLSFGGGSRTKAVNGASVMRKVRREVKEIAQIHGTLSRPIKAPTGRSVVTKAPEAMVNDHKRAALPPYRPANLREPTQLDPELQKEFKNDPECVRSFLLEAALEEYESRASYLSDSEENGDSADSAVSQPKQPAPAAPKPAARPAAPKVPTTALQRKFGGSKSAFKAPAAPSAPVVKAREPVPKRQLEQPEQPEQKRPRLRAFPAPDLPTGPNSPPMDEENAPKDMFDVLKMTDAKVAKDLEAKAPAAKARMAQIYRKRKNVDIFAHPKKRVH